MASVSDDAGPLPEETAKRDGEAPVVEGSGTTDETAVTAAERGTEPACGRVGAERTPAG